MSTNKQALRNDAIRAGGGKWYYLRSSLHSKAYITDANGETVLNVTNGDVPAKYAGFLESANPATVLALLDELEAAEKMITELSVSHSKLHEGMAAIYNAICENGASTSLSAILTFVKRAFEESKTAAGITVKGE